MAYKIKCRADEEGPLLPETLETFDAAKQRVRHLVASQPSSAASRAPQQAQTQDR
jgi:hypothetical protein